MSGWWKTGSSIPSAEGEIEQRESVASLNLAVVMSAPSLAFSCDCYSRIQGLCGSTAPWNVLVIFCCVTGGDAGNLSASYRFWTPFSVFQPNPTPLTFRDAWHLWFLGLSGFPWHGSWPPAACLPLPPAATLRQVHPSPRQLSSSFWSWLTFLSSIMHLLFLAPVGFYVLKQLIILLEFWERVDINACLICQV